jgi:hypothetical protein
MLARKLVCIDTSIDTYRYLTILVSIRIDIAYRVFPPSLTASVFLHQCEGIERYVQNMLDPVDVRRQLAEVLGSPGSTPRFGLWKGLN